jgi:hypothetical protein
LNFFDVPRRSRLFYGGNHTFYGAYRPGCRKCYGGNYTILWRLFHANWLLLNCEGNTVPLHPSSGRAK